MEISDDRRFEIVFAGRRGVSYAAMDVVVSRVCLISKSLQRELVEELFEEFEEISLNDRDAIRFRLNSIKPKRFLRIEAAQSGSIVLSVALLTVAYWIVDKTLGQSISSAWSGSDLDLRIQAFLRRRVFDHRRRLFESLPRQRFSMEGVYVSAYAEDDPHAPKISVSSEEILDIDNAPLSKPKTTPPPSSAA